MLGASFDPIDANAAFAKKYDFPFRLLSDVNRMVGMAYGAADGPQAATAKRTSTLIDPEGRVAQVWPKVKPADHAAEVLAAVPG